MSHITSQFKKVHKTWFQRNIGASLGFELFNITCKILVCRLSNWKKNFIFIEDAKRVTAPSLNCEAVWKGRKEGWILTGKKCGNAKSSLTYSFSIFIKTLKWLKIKYLFSDCLRTMSNIYLFQFCTETYEENVVQSVPAAKHQELLNGTRVERSQEKCSNEFFMFYEPILSTEGGHYNSKDKKVHTSSLNSPTTPPCWEVKLWQWAIFRTSVQTIRFHLFVLTGRTETNNRWEQRHYRRKKNYISGEKKVILKCPLFFIVFKVGKITC